VEFYHSPVDDQDHLRVYIPGDSLNQPDFIASPYYQHKFKKQWEAYQNSASQDSGIPLESAAWLDDATRRLLKRHSIFSLEQLSLVSDGALASIGPGATTMRTRAKKELESLKKAEEYPELQKRLIEAEKQIAQLTKTRNR